MALKNYYNILGIQQTATQDEVKKAFRKLSIKFHPDKNDGDTFLMEMFKSINEANEVLSDPTKRREYNQKLIDADSVRDRNDINQSPTQSTYTNQAEEKKEVEEVYDLWNVYLEKKKRTDNAYRNLISVRSYDKPQFITAKKVLTSVLILLLVWLFLKPTANSEKANNDYTFIVKQKAAVFTKPNKQSKQIDELVQGTSFTLMSETNYFYKIEYTKSDGSLGKGYILKVSIH